MTMLNFVKGCSFELSPHFDVNEFHCKCTYVDCSETNVSTDLIELLESIHTLMEESIGHAFPIKITSGFRCVKHNTDTPGAAPDSQHPLGTAADIIIPNKFQRMVDIVVGSRGGVGFYEDRLHVDVRGTRERWSVK